MMKKKILVFPCGSEIGLDIYSSVRYSTHFHLIGASSVEDHGAFVYDDYISGLPFINEPGFIPAIKQIVLDKKIDAIYPAMDSVITLLKAHEAELGCIVISSPLQTTRICLSKLITYRTLEKVVHTPKIYTLEDVIHFPVFLKPDIGYGSRGTALIEDLSSLKNIVERNPKILMLEYLPGKEFTVDCFTDRRGRLIYSAARSRNRIKDGISVNTSFVDDQQEFQEIAQTINREIEFRGAWFFQVKRDSEENLCLLEIASRLGGSSLLSRAKGVNLALLTLFDAFDVNVDIQINDSYEVILDRALENRYRCNGLQFDTVYIDYDDCLVIDNHLVNTEMIRFLYMCSNHRIKRVLLTRHRGDLKEEMHRLGLICIFDEIIHLGDCGEKYSYINSKNAIFIDDSYVEREKVMSHCSIPVFGPEMVDLLLDSL